MPPAEGAFAATRWSLVCAAADAGSPAQCGAMEELCRAYWAPLYAFARRTGWPPDDARDATQAFFARVIERGILVHARAERGRFRTFLLAVFRNFLADEHDRARAHKRGGGMEFVEMDARKLEEMCRAEIVTAAPPDATFDKQWAMTVLERAAARLREEFSGRGREVVFDQLKVFLVQDGGPEPFRAACAAAGITLNNGRVTLHRLRERFPALLREEVAQTARSPEELEAELRYLLEVLSA